MADADHIAARISLRQRFGRVGGRLRPGVHGFWSWWTQALLAWLPLRLRELLGLVEQRLLLRLRGGSLALLLERGGQARLLAELPWAAAAAPAEEPLARVLRPQVAELPRWLVLTAVAGLRRRMLVPGAAAERLREVLGFEIDRQTPFAAADVCFDARLLERRADGQLEVELVVAPRSAVDAALAALGPPADGLAGVDLDDGEGEPLGVNLLPETRRYRRADPWQRWNLALAAVALLATAAALWQVLENRRAAADAFEQASLPRIEQARAASAQRQQLDDLIEGMRHLEQARAARPTMVELLDELSRRLPDSTYLEKLAIENERMLLIGLSSEASALIGQLEESALWRSPALTGAVQPDPRTRRDRFTLTAEIAVDQPAAAGGTGGADAPRDP
ncbi:PilN domain-containing protein [Luteimonas sp. SJ-92]|uniref:PilN domain-containing protein n=1 Tax=Luteimonas salinisoli TaxID=2752307 RepID=A0A853JIK4_9GAMM|nr:PilN domain-containing protein [Luteimonas salinisoli]NZA28409.1 PilN domain-containing protein [Luteimonas salinisoli]